MNYIDPWIDVKKKVCNFNKISYGTFSHVAKRYRDVPDLCIWRGFRRTEILNLEEHHSILLEVIVESWNLEFMA